VKSGRTRRALLDAGLEVFSEKGYQASTVESIAGRADVTSSTFDEHFRDVEDLFIELIGEVFGELYEDAFLHEPSPIGMYDERRTIQGLRRVIQRYVEYAGLWRALLEAALVSPAIERAWFLGRSRLSGELVDRTVRMQDAGLMRRMDAELCVDGLISGVEWYVVSRAAFSSAGPLVVDDDAVAGLIDLWLHAIGMGSTS
jgi:AcrR family transcriptional regulator